MASTGTYMRLSQFAKQHFVEGSRPSLSTLRRLVEKGELPGRRFGEHYYVDYSAYLANGNPLVDKIVRLEHKLSECIELFRREGMQERHWKPTTRKLYDYRLNRIDADLGRRAVESLTVKDCAEYLREVTPSLRAREQYRGALILLLECAVQEGWISHNIAKATRVAKAERQRARLTLEA
ncbi:MAG: hypothetical protein ACYDB9_08355 [Gammaproteobacteria bacterium]